jgi:hypothetical protein
MRRLLVIALCFFFTGTALAQFTTVTGTVTDPNGLPYAGGTISAKLTSSASPTLNGFAYTPPTQPAGLNSAGTFIMQLADNAQLLPAASTWDFRVCSAVGTVQPAFGKGPVCFVVTGITISGASQDIGATLRAAAPALTATFSSTGITCSTTCTAGIVPVFTGAATVANSLLTSSATQIQLGSSSNFLTNALGITTDERNNTLASCGGANVIPLPVFGCMGYRMIDLNQAGTNSGVSAGISVSHHGSNFTAGTLGVGLASQEAADNNLTETRAGYFEAFEQVNTTVTTRRGIFAFAGNGTGNTTTTNEAIVAQTYASSSTNTNDFTVHVLAPTLVAGTLTTHAGLKVDAQATGVEMQMGAHVFSALPTCNATYEGSMAAVTDATSATNGATVVGGGAHHVMAYCNSVNWLVVVGT